MKFSGVFLLILAGFFLGACSSSDPEKPKRSFWDSVTGLFSSTPDAKGSDEQQQKLKDLDQEIREIQWKYSRENRPQKKSRYKDYLEQLRISRDSLVIEIEKGSHSSGQGSGISSSSRTISSSAANGNSSSEISSSAVSSSSAAVPAATLESGMILTRVDSVYVTTTITKIVRDTVFIRDTLIVRDTVFLPSPQN